MTLVAILGLLLLAVAIAFGIVAVEFGYRPSPEHQYWVSDFAVTSHARYEGLPADGVLPGAPELVVEVLSPSNTAFEIRDKRKLCLENGSVQFWVADADQCEMEVWTPDGRSVTYRAGQQIPLFFAPGSFVSVDAIFE